MHITANEVGSYSTIQRKLLLELNIWLWDYPYYTNFMNAVLEKDSYVEWERILE